MLFFKYSFKNLGIISSRKWLWTKHHHEFNPTFPRCNL